MIRNDQSANIKLKMATNETAQSLSTAKHTRTSVPAITSGPGQHPHIKTTNQTSSGKTIAVGLPPGQGQRGDPELKEQNKHSGFEETLCG